MANIMITYRCNLQCSYCFANEFVNKSYTDMTLEDFKKVVNFLAAKPGAVIGLIGGEPTIHPQFKEMLLYLSECTNVKSVMLYTNGLVLDKHVEFLSRPDLRSMLKILVNCNSPEMMGEANYQHLVDNLDLMVDKYHMAANIKLGVNLYENAFDYTYIKELLKRYNMYQIRISLTVPDFASCGKVNVLDHFESRKKYLLKFYKEMDEIGVLAYYDCNRPPKCVFTDEEWAWICWYRKKYSIFPSNITDENVHCAPIIDILPNKQAVRCFGMSEVEKVSIDDFDSVEDIKRYYEKGIDYGAWLLPTDAQCGECYSYQAKKCAGGCIGFKYSDIQDVTEYIRNKYKIV